MFWWRIDPCRLATLSRVRRGRVGWRGRVEVERTHEDVDETPNRDHDKEANEAPEHELLTALALLFIMSSLDEVLEDTPDKDDEGERKDDRHRNVVDKIDDDTSCIVHAVDLREGEKRKSECDTDVTEFLLHIK